MGRILLLCRKRRLRSTLRQRLEAAGHEVALAPPLGGEDPPELVLAALEAGEEPRPELFGDGVVEAEAGPGRRRTPLVVWAEGEEEAARALPLRPDLVLRRADLPALAELVALPLAAHAEAERLRRELDDLRARCRLLERRAVAADRAVEADGAPGRLAGVLLTDAAGRVRLSDAGFRRAVGRGVEGERLSTLLPGSGAEAAVRDLAAADAPRRLRVRLQGEGPELAARVHRLLPPPRGEALRLVLLEEPARPPLAEGRELAEELRHHLHPGLLVGRSRAAVELRRAVLASAPREEPLLAVGRRGSRRPRVALVLHALACRPGAFLPVPAGALEPADLAAREGGLLDRARGGTLFVADLEELSEAAAERLARVLEGGEERAAGARVVASCADEAALPESLRGRFPLRAAVAPLAERAEDVPLLAQAFLARLRPDPDAALTPAAAATLAAYGWPGEERELEEVLARAEALASGRAIARDDLPAHLRALEVPERHALVPRPLPAAPTLEDCELYCIELALARCGGDRGEAARQLRIAKSTLYRKLVRHGLA